MRTERSRCWGPKQGQGSGTGEGLPVCQERRQGQGTSGKVTSRGAGTWEQTGWTTFLLDATMQGGFYWRDYGDGCFKD